MKIKTRNGLKIEFYELLIVEGNDGYFSFLKHISENVGLNLATESPLSVPREFNTHRCKTIAEAINELEDVSIPYDAVLVSNRSLVAVLVANPSPKNAKKDAIKNLVRCAGAAPVLLMTTMAKDDDIRECLDAGVMHCVSLWNVRDRGPQLLVDAILDAIAQRHGWLAREESRADAIAKKEQLTLRIGQAVAIVVWAFLVFVADPSVRSRSLVLDFSREGVFENFLRGVVPIFSVNVRPIREWFSKLKYPKRLIRKFRIWSQKCIRKIMKFNPLRRQ